MGDEEARINQLAENMRFYGEMRFKQLTLFAGAMTVLAAALGDHGHTMLTHSLSARFAVAIAGLLVTTTFWVMEIRSTLFWVAIRQELQGKEVWPRPQAIFGWLNATNTTLFLHFVCYSLWLYFAQDWSYHRKALLIVGSSWLAFLCLFTVLSYWPLWTYRETDKSSLI